MATNAIHTLKLGSTEYPIYSEGFKIGTLGNSSAAGLYPLLLSDKYTDGNTNPTSADDSKAVVAHTVGHLSYSPAGKTLYTKNLRIGGIPESGNPGGTLYLSGYVNTATEDGTSVSLGESNQVLASGGGDNSVHWRTIDLVGNNNTIGLVKNGSSVNPDGDTWKPVAFKDGVPYYQEVKVDISNMPELDAVLDDLRNSIFSEGPGIEISGGADGSAKTISVAKATEESLGGIMLGSTAGHPVKLDTYGKAYIETIVCKTPQTNVSKTDTAGDGKVVTGVTINQNTNGEITGVTVTETDLPTYEDKSVTSVEYHYEALTADDSKTLTAEKSEYIGDVVDITQNPTPVITGIKRDTAGHVVDIVTMDLYSSGIEIPDGPDLSGYKTKQTAVNKTDTAGDGKVVTGVTINQNTNGEITGVTVAETSFDDTYLKTSGGTVNGGLTVNPGKDEQFTVNGLSVINGTLNIENDGITIVSNSTIESAGFRASLGVEIDGTDITGESPNTFFIGDRSGNNHVIFGVDGNGVTTTEVKAANITTTDVSTDTIHVNKIVLPDGEITSSDTSDFVTKSTEQEISGKKTFTDTITGKDIDLSREGETQFILSDAMGVMMGNSNNSIKYHHLIGRNDNNAWASFAGGAAVFKYEDKSSHLKTVYVDNLLQTPILQSETGMIQSVPSSSKFTFNTGDTTPLEINAASATFNVQVISSEGFVETSDERKKNFIRPIDVDLEKLSTLKKHYFTWKDGNGKMQIGTSAQEVREMYPELVNEAEDGTLTVAYNKLSVVALAAIDKLHDENNELKKKVSTLEERLERIESLLEGKLNNL